MRRNRTRSRTNRRSTFRRRSLYRKKRSASFRRKRSVKRKIGNVKKYEYYITAALNDERLTWERQVAVRGNEQLVVYLQHKFPVIKQYTCYKFTTDDVMLALYHAVGATSNVKLKPTSFVIKAKTRQHLYPLVFCTKHPDKTEWTVVDSFSKLKAKRKFYANKLRASAYQGEYINYEYILLSPTLPNIENGGQAHMTGGVINIFYGMKYLNMENVTGINATAPLQPQVTLQE